MEAVSAFVSFNVSTSWLENRKYLQSNRFGEFLSVLTGRKHAVYSVPASFGKSSATKHECALLAYWSSSLNAVSSLAGVIVVRPCYRKFVGRMLTSFLEKAGRCQGTLGLSSFLESVPTQPSRPCRHPSIRTLGERYSLG